VRYADSALLNSNAESGGDTKRIAGVEVVDTTNEVHTHEGSRTGCIRSGSPI